MSEEHHYIAVNDTILPMGSGKTQRVKPGEELHGEIYEQFLPTGFIRRFTPAPHLLVPADKSETSAKEEGAGQDSGLSRKELEAMTKTDLQALAPGVKGGKNKLIDHILQQETTDEHPTE